MVDFLFIIIEFFCCLLRLRHKQKSVEVHILQREWDTFGEYFGWKETTPNNPHWSGKTGDIPLSYGVKILIFCHNTHIWQTDRKTNRQNCDSYML